MIPEAVRRRDLVGYGRNPPPFRWPDDARVVVNLVLVYEEGSEYSVLWGDDRNDGWGEYPEPGVQPPARDPGTESHYEYGSRAGVWRLARIYDAAGVPVTVSATATALELNPGVAVWMREQGHDLLGHGWRWTQYWEMSREEEREHLHRAIETYERVLGTRPLGWNCRSWPSENTAALLAEDGGFLYESDGTADDVPYYRVVDGRPMLVVPYSKTYNDSRFVTNPGFASPRDYVETATMGLDELLREGDERRTMMTVVAHARWSGQAARAAAIRLFIEHALAQPGVRFMRRADIARWWLERYPAELMAGRIALFSSAVPGWDAQRVASAAVSLGLDAVEWGIGPGQAITSPDEGPRIVALGADARLAVAGLAVQEESVTLATPRTGARHVALAAALRAPHVRFFAPVYERGSLASAQRRARAGLDRLVDLGARAAVAVLVETAPGTIAPSPDLALELVGHHRPGRAGVLYDPGNMAIEGHVAAPLALARLGRHLRHVHVKNIAWSRRGGAWRWGYADLDRGAVEWAVVLRALEAAGYRGRLSIDHLGSRPTPALLRSESARLRQLLAEASR